MKKHPKKPNFALVRSVIAAIITLIGTTTHAQTQQKVSYDIKVRLDDQNHFLHAQQSMAYTNNFDASISVIYFHLWANAYKNNQTAFAKQQLRNKNTKFYYAPDADKGYIDSLNFEVNGEKVQWSLLADSIDICKIYLNRPLRKGETINITTPFRLKIPVSFSRLGHADQAYQITQWYPKPAVFNGKSFDYMPYLDQGEFYSEFGDFHVAITLPKNYVVGATGDLETQSEQVFLDELAQKTAKIDSFDSKDLTFPPSSTEYKTIHYYQDNVHDFAWFADKRFNVLHSSIKLPNSDKVVKTQALFTNLEGNLWKNGTLYIDSAVYYYSLWNGNYPYNICTALEGALSAGAGMEYPTITIIGESRNARSLDLVIAHEVGHNWFYGILGSNERNFGWMDEGINSYYETRYMNQRYPEKNPLASIGLPANIKLKAKMPENIDMFLANLQASRLKDQPCQLHSNEMTSLNYGAIMYKKTAAVLYYLADYLGQQKFDDVMHQYYKTWSFHHPQPKDIKNVFEKETGKDLSWFFDDLIATTKHIDYAFAGAKKQPDGSFLLKTYNLGSIAAPLKISAMDKQNKILSAQSFEGFDDVKKLSFNTLPAAAPVHHFIIDAQGISPEYNIDGNRVRAKGILKNYQCAKPKFLMGIDDPTQRKIYYTPIIGGNHYDSWLLGAAIYSSVLPKDAMSYIMPLYSTATKSLVGQMGMEYYFYPQKHNGAKNVRLSLNAKSYHYNIHNYSNFVGGAKTFYDRYMRYNAEVVYTFKPKGAASKITHTAGIALTKINQNETLVKSANDSLLVFDRDTTYNYGALRLHYEMKNARILNPYSLRVDFITGANSGEQTNNYGRISAEANYTLSFEKKGKGLKIRAFGGGFLWHNFKPIVGLPGYRRSSVADFRLSSYTGTDDFLYDNTYLGRSETEGILSRRMNVADGGFKMLQNSINPPTGRNNVWLAAINLESSLPVTPISIFADFGAFPTTDVFTGASTTTTAYDAGVSLNVLKGAVAIYVPLIASENLKNNPLGNEFYRNISFSVRIDRNTNVFRLLRDLDM
jgi:hypothetical protein